MHIFVKPITYVTAHCDYFSFAGSRSTLSCLKKLCLLKSENDHEMSQSQTVDQTKVPWGRNTEHFRSWLHFVII